MHLSFLGLLTWVKKTFLKQVSNYHLSWTVSIIKKQAFEVALQNALQMKSALSNDGLPMGSIPDVTCYMLHVMVVSVLMAAASSAQQAAAISDSFAQVHLLPASLWAASTKASNEQCYHQLVWATTLQLAKSQYTLCCALHCMCVQANSVPLQVLCAVAFSTQNVSCAVGEAALSATAVHITTYQQLMSSL